MELFFLGCLANASYPVGSEGVAAVIDLPGATFVQLAGLAAVALSLEAARTDRRIKPDPLDTQPRFTASILRLEVDHVGPGPRV
jgi:hypothetical protein